jgi:hypothetical protein
MSLSAWGQRWGVSKRSEMVTETMRAAFLTALARVPPFTLLSLHDLCLLMPGASEEQVRALAAEASTMGQQWLTPVPGPSWDGERWRRTCR